MTSGTMTLGEAMAQPTSPRRLRNDLAAEGSGEYGADGSASDLVQSTGDSVDSASVLSNIAALEDLCDQLRAQLQTMREVHGKKLTGPDKRLAETIGQKLSAGEMQIEFAKAQLAQRGVQYHPLQKSNVQDGMTRGEAIAAAQALLSEHYARRARITKGTEKASERERKVLYNDITQLENEIELCKLRAQRGAA